MMCSICMEDVRGDETTTMDCGHCFCNICWTEHFIVKITEGHSRHVSFMAYKCNAICNEGKVRKLVKAKDSSVAEKFDRFLLESYIDDNKMVKWCPSVPHCGNAIRVEIDEYCEVECACGLQFCFNCSLKAHSPGSCLMWEMWAKKCSDESETGRKLVKAKDSSVAEKSDWFLLESYIDDNKLVKWCPSVPHCGNAIRVEIDEYCEVECVCGLQFCFNCSLEAHSPCSSLMWEMWAKKCSEESETVNWITVNTKPCPKCHKLVEKNGGCNLIWCICGQAFCWLCAEATGWSHTMTSIAGHKCEGYKIREVTRKASEKELLRYIHYYNRYKGNTDSLKAEVRLKNDLVAKVAALEKRDSTWADCSWVWNGHYRLFRSRKIISYSYPFAYYMFGQNVFHNEIPDDERVIKQVLFENHQQHLEMNIEKILKGTRRTISYV